MTTVLIMVGMIITD